EDHAHAVGRQERGQLRQPTPRGRFDLDAFAHVATRTRRPTSAPRTTATTRKRPWKASWYSGLMCAKKRTFTTAVRAKAPAIAPMALPRPPKKLIPPRTTEAIEVRMNASPEVASPAVVVATKNRPPAAASVPEKTYAPTFVRRIGTPCALAASSSLPSTKSLTPNDVLR